PKSPSAVDALIQVVRVQNGTANPAGKESPGGKALARLLRDHIQNVKLGEVCRLISYGFREEYETFLRTVIDKNPHRDVLALAHLALAEFLDNRQQRLDLLQARPDMAKEYDSRFGKAYLEMLRRQDGARVVTQIEALFERAAANYRNVKVTALWAGAKAMT